MNPCPPDIASKRKCLKNSFAGDDFFAYPESAGPVRFALGPPLPLGIKPKGRISYQIRYCDVTVTVGDNALFPAAS